MEEKEEVVEQVIAKKKFSIIKIVLSDIVAIPLFFIAISAAYYLVYFIVSLIQAVPVVDFITAASYSPVGGLGFAGVAIYGGLGGMVPGLFLGKIHKNEINLFASSVPIFLIIIILFILTFISQVQSLGIIGAIFSANPYFGALLGMGVGFEIFSN